MDWVARQPLFGEAKNIKIESSCEYYEEQIKTSYILDRYFIVISTL